jgi:hypothetical protein
MTDPLARHLDRFYRKGEAAAPRGRASLNFTGFGGREVKTAAGPTLELSRRYGWADLPGRGSLERIVQEGWRPAQIDPRHARQVPLERMLFVDIETTGLSIGAGTVAFLVGTVQMDAGGLLLRQFLLRDFSEEAALQTHLNRSVESAGVIVTYNGGRFDLPVLRSRAVLNRVDAPWLELPHLDLLHPVRAVWRNLWPDCRLATAENRLLGVVRDVDCEGWEVPLRYRQFLTEQSEEPLVAVLEHNAQDLISLCCLAAVIERLFDPDRGWFGLAQSELFGLARALVARGRENDALEALAHGRAMGRLAPEYMRAMRLEVRLRKRSGHHATVREILADIALSDDPFDRYWAALEWAKGHEHHEGDFRAALEAVGRAGSALDLLPRTGLILKLSSELRHRRERLERRLHRG